jgi:NAD(P)H-flavin reductase
MLPRPFRVVERRQDTVDTATLTLEPVDGAPLTFAPGQFTMLGLLGVGEVPISISGDPGGALLLHTIRDVGGVTHALVEAQVGDLLEVRGPYGTGWGVEQGRGGDVVIVAGGIGLAPLRPAVLRLLAERERYGRVALLCGARSPADQLYPMSWFAGATTASTSPRSSTTERLGGRAGSGWSPRSCRVSTSIRPTHWPSPAGPR